MLGRIFLQNHLSRGLFFFFFNIYLTILGLIAACVSGMQDLCCGTQASFFFFGAQASCTCLQHVGSAVWLPGPRACRLRSCGAWVVALRHVESSQTRDWTCFPFIGRWVFIHYTIREVMFFAFWRCFAACGILFPSAGIQPALLVKAWSLNHWTARETSDHNFG